MPRRDRLHFTGDEEANRLLVREPLALVIGFALDQQVTVQTAFTGPLKLKRRLGRLDATEVAAMDPAELEAVFCEKPAVHRFPRNMAKRTQDLCSHISEEYDGDAARIWMEAPDAAELQARIAALPGFGEMKIASFTAVLAKLLGVRPPGIEEVLPDYPTMGDVTSAKALEAYQATKRAAKAACRAHGTSG